MQSLPAPFTQEAIDQLNSSTDWYKAITRTAFREDNTLNISGGNEKTSYYLSGDYLTDKGTVLASQNNRASLRANLSSDVNNWYTVKAQLSLTRQKTSRAITLSNGFPGSDGVILDALRASPIVAVDYSGFNGEGIPGFTDGNIFSNPVTELQQKTDNLYSDFTIANIENDFKIAKGLKLIVNLGTNQNLSHREVFFPATTASGYNTNGSGINNISNTYNYNANAYLDYRREFKGGHNVNITGGVEYNHNTVEMLNTSTSGYDIPSFGIYNIGSAQIQSTGSFKEAKVIQSAFLRANYTYKDRYVLNASVRDDGASSFAENKKYGVFPAIGLAWNLSNETFMKKFNWISNTKLRASYGETGSQAIQPYSSLAQYGNAFYQTGTTNTINTALYPATLGNANLSWERTKQLNVGLDFSLIKSILSVSFDYYNKETDGLLQPRSLPNQTGFGSVEDNYGSMRNRGVEATVNANIVSSGAFRYSTKVTISHNKNVLLNLGDLTAPQYVSLGGNLQGGVSGILKPGQEIGLFYGYTVAGLVQTGDIVNGVPKYPYPGAASGQIAGQWKFADVNGDGQINSDDMRVLGKSNPDFTYGWNNDISFKNFSLNLFFTGSQGNSIVNLTRFYLSDGTADYSGIFFNQTADWYAHRWTPTNPTNNPRYPGIQKSLPIADLNSSYLENGSYFRLKSATVSWYLPKNNILKNARLFVTGTNLFTITKYTGADPEIGSYGQSLLQQGIDYGAYAGYRTYTIGFSTNF
ncbi:TonB-linked outer membrane protein, SusC/RagA family [Mucilaginibacter gossypiicola]|uniref:TonB-linked outer membrane protein, SusC/RagA family n=1 Tax=Mucilaginibacter gossypiicola TaxID=551995 RepID=A0A1H8BQR2_9SPHI|nr:SusC/RagA family TonB-linked outer membrane protein [Mucilaginibacter gossypiicola]SEM84358.1 TonB-linked outer membrane protein, SusC/RagA family [Mucilaginibacter gossypiicola]